MYHSRCNNSSALPVDEFHCPARVMLTSFIGLTFRDGTHIDQVVVLAIFKSMGPKTDLKEMAGVCPANKRAYRQNSY